MGPEKPAAQDCPDSPHADSNHAQRCVPLSDTLETGAFNAVSISPLGNIRCLADLALMMVTYDLNELLTSYMNPTKPNSYFSQNHEFTILTTYLHTSAYELQTLHAP